METKRRQKMKFEEALKAMREGKQVRIGNCKCGYIVDEHPGYSLIIDSAGDSVKFDSHAIMADDWEIVE
jgi:hypothetical protein